MPSPLFAVVVHDGVSTSEAAAFDAVFRAVPGGRAMLVGTQVGPVAGAGAGRALIAEARLDDVRPDVVAVPGGLGSHRHLEIASWIEASAPRVVVASSTGVGLLAAGGLLHGRRVTTHWLAGDQVGALGATVVDDRIVVDGGLITCQGAISGIEAALAAVAAVGGPGLAAATRAAVAAHVERPACARTRRRWFRRRTDRADLAAGRRRR